MEFENRAIIVGVNLGDRIQSPSSQHIFAEVVLIDRSHDVLQPTLYQLTSDSLNQQHQQHGFMPIEENAFAMMGEVLTIDKQKKIIYLTNHITVSYQHLIVASGLSQSILGSTHDEELSAGLNALMEAIRVRKNSSKALHFQAINQMQFRPNKAAHRHQVNPEHSVSIQNIQNIQKILNPLNFSEPEKSLEMILASTEKRLYEVQL